MSMNNSTGGWTTSKRGNPERRHPRILDYLYATGSALRTMVLMLAMMTLFAVLLIISLGAALLLGAFVVDTGWGGFVMLGVVVGAAWYVLQRKFHGG